MGARSVSALESPATKKAPIVSLLIVAYNSRDFINDCLSSVPAACGEIDYEILLIDNGNDHTQNFVRDLHPNVTVIPSRGNIGFGAGNNLLAKHTHPGTRYLIMVNPDTRLHAGSVRELVKAADAHQEYAALSGKIELPSGRPFAASFMAPPTVYRMALGAVGLADWAAARHRIVDERHEVIPVAAISGGYMLVRRNDWNTLHGFDETFFLYGEDIDLCHRIQKAGGRVGLVPGARVYHDVGSGEFYSPLRTRYKVIADAHFAKRHFGPFRRWAFMAALWLHCWIRFGAGTLLAWRGTRMAMLAKAFREPALNPMGWMRGFASQGADPRRHDG